MEHLARELIDLMKIAKVEKQDTLAYLLELAIAEAHDQIDREKPKKSANTQ